MERPNVSLSRDRVMTQPPVIRDLSTHPGAYLSVRMLAHYWHVDRRLVDKWVAAGLLPAVRFPGGLRRVRREDAIAFELLHRIASCSESGA